MENHVKVVVLYIVLQIDPGMRLNMELIDSVRLVGTFAKKVYGGASSRSIPLSVMVKQESILAL
jgi:hypothetical protein